MHLSRNTYSDIASGSTQVQEMLSDEAFITAIVEFEKALAQVAATTGLISVEQADAAAAATDSFTSDMVDIAEGSMAGANPAIPIVAKLKALATDTAGIHVASTSQDAVDTALALCSTRAKVHLLEEVTTVESLLVALSWEYRNAPMMARTLGQQAVPTTFGAVVAGWLEGITSAGAALRAVQLPVQYAGPAGTVPGGIDTHDALADFLGLAKEPVVWHTNRQPVVEFGAALARLAGAVRKVAGDIIMHSATEVAELREPTPGGSSSMPHKANPAASVAADGYARRTPGLVATLFDSLDCRAQRGIGSWHAEWQTLRELIACTASSVTSLRRALDGIVVNTEVMADRAGDDPAIGHATVLVEKALKNRGEGKDHEQPL